MEDFKVYGWEMALISETYLSTLSEKMTKRGIDRYFVPFLYIHQHSGNITQKDMATALKRDKVTVMRMVDHLSELGLVKRTSDPSDRRCHILETTHRAKNIAKEVKKAIGETNELLFGDFSPSEKKVFAAGMDKLMKQIDVLPESDYIVQAIRRKKK